MATQSATFTYTGSSQTFTVPRHKPGTLRVTVVGAQGGDYVSSAPFLGGHGGSIRGYLTMSRGTTVTVVVGQAGHDSGDHVTLTPAGGGPALGGAGGNGGRYFDDGGAGGGGSSDVRTSSSVADRIIVAGGGGGGGAKGGTGTVNGSPGGLGIASGGGQQPPGIYSGDGQGGFPGTTSAAGAGGAKATGSTSGVAGTAGSGGDGGAGAAYAGGALSNGGGAGGGGGYYGGGGGGSRHTSGTLGGGGGGGSSWADTGVFSTVDDISYNSGSGAASAHSPHGFVLFEWEPAVGGIYVDGAVHF